MTDIRLQDLDKLSENEPLENQPTPEQKPEPENTNEPPQDLPSVPEPAPQPEPEPTPDPVKEVKKVELDVFDFIKNNKDTVLSIFEKDKDYSGISNEDALRLKLQKENPEWDASDVEAELQDKYSVGLQKIEIDEESMTDEEIKEAKAINKKIDASARALKKDGKSAVEYLANLHSDVELPKFEFEYEESASAKPEDFLKEYQEKIEEQYKKQKQEVWIPELKQALGSVDAISEEVKYVDNGNEVVLNVNYKMSEAEKSEIEADLADYVSQKSDERYIVKDDKGEVIGMDVQRFVQDKSEEMLRKKIYKTIAKEAAAKARAEFVKNGVVNYSDEARNSHMSDSDEDSLENFMLKR